MFKPRRGCLLLAALLVVSALLFTTGVGWGLPSRRADRFLFGSRRPWTGKEIEALTRSGQGRWDDPARGADVAGGIGEPAQQRDVPVRVNATDAERAQIVRRYRLFSYQPDEMITLMSLARMHPPGDLDPRLYQYGGLWIYPVGALLKIGSAVGYVHLVGGDAGRAFYLDNPRAFGRFYIVARLYAALWGLVAVWAIYRLVSNLLGGDRRPALLAAGLFALLPVTINMAHEAKPHLPGVALLLLAALAGTKYVRTGRWRDALRAGALCGAAMGMVLSMAPAFVIVPIMAWIGPGSLRRRVWIALGAGAMGLGVYAVFNPYVIAHQFWQREVFASNIGNSAAMYEAGQPTAGAVNVMLLAGAGATAPMALAGALGLAALAWRAARRRRDRSAPESLRRATGLLLGAPALLIAAQAVLVGAGKPGEFGRFLLAPDAFLVVEAVVAPWTFVGLAGRVRRTALVTIAAALLLSTGWRAAIYVNGFRQDAGPMPSRLRDARLLDLINRSDEARSLAVAADPAPYCLPPVDLWHWRIIRLPGLPPVGREFDDAGAGMTTTPTPTDALVRPVDDFGWFGAPISWANKPMEIRVAGEGRGAPG